MSRIRANNIVNGAGTGAPTFPNGAIISGIATINADIDSNSNLTANQITSLQSIGVGTGATVTNPADNELAFNTNGSERLRITSGGRIGINNTSGPTDIPGTVHDTVVVGNSAATGGGITLEVASGNNCSFQMYAQGSQPAGRFLYDGSENTVKIWSQNSGGTSESARMTFKEDGNVEINDGNLVLASGHGIDFSATSDGSGTASSELLDDYERGFFTPKISFGGSDAGVTYTTNNGAYTKVGRLVTCYGVISLSSNGSSTGNAAIFNLPFTSNADALSGTSLEGGGHNTYQSGCSGTIYGPMSLGVIQNNTYASYYGATTTGGNMSNMTESNLSNTYDCRFILWYYT